MAMPPKIRTPNKGRSRLSRYSLRVLLLLITIVAIACGILAYRVQSAKQQAVALRKIEELGGRPLRTTYRDGRYYSGGKLPEPRFKWLHKLLGEDYFTYVPAIEVQNPAITADQLRAMIPYLNQIRLVSGLNQTGKTNLALIDVGNPNIDDKLVKEFALRVPQCVFTSTLVGQSDISVAK